MRIVSAAIAVVSYLAPSQVGSLKFSMFARQRKKFAILFLVGGPNYGFAKFVIGPLLKEKTLIDQRNGWD